MGQVYRARDTKLNRDVAIKVLPDSFANDADRLARFQREAEVLASLNHPNIAAIYGLEEGQAGLAGQARQARSIALVMELVEGLTLAELLAGPGPLAFGSGPGNAQSQRPKAPGLPLEEVLPIAMQIVD